MTVRRRPFSMRYADSSIKHIITPGQLYDETPSIRSWDMENTMSERRVLTPTDARVAHLTPIDARIVDDYVAVPQGMTLKYLHSLDGKMIAHVAGWTAAGQDDSKVYDLYPLANAQHFTIFLNRAQQDWYAFG